MSIRLRLTLWYSAVLAVILILFGFILYSLFSFGFYGEIKTNLRKEAASVKDDVSIELPSLNIGLPRLDFYRSYQYYLQFNPIEGYGRVQTSDNLQNVQLPNGNLLKKIKVFGSVFDTVSINNVDLLVYESPVQLSSGQIVGVLQVATPIGHVQESLDLITYILFVMGIVTLILSATVGWFLSGKVLKPVHRIIVETDQIEKAADLGRRIPYSGPNDEIGVLTHKINNMLSRLQVVYSELEETNRAQRRFVSDASHELRTPLTTIRGNVDLMKKMLSQMREKLKTDEFNFMSDSMETIHDIATEAERMSRLVNDLLALARVDDGMRIDLEDIELKPVVEEVIRKAQFLTKKVEWRTGDISLLNDVHIRGNKDYLQQLLFIFIDNAFKYTNEGHVQLDAVRKDNQIGIRIIDTGIGMNKEEVPLIFERFYRADPSRGQTSGTGLGLSIAKWLVDGHDGSVEVFTKKGEGTTFVIWFPVSFSLEADYDIIESD